jgi:hypothetical protein
MNLIEIFLPLNDSSGRPFGTDAAVREHLTKRFGGLTAFSRSAAQGATSDGGKTVHDEIIVFEVMTDSCTKASTGNRVNCDPVVGTCSSDLVLINPQGGAQRRHSSKDGNQGEAQCTRDISSSQAAPLSL